MRFFSHVNCFVAAMALSLCVACTQSTKSISFSESKTPIRWAVTKFPSELDWNLCSDARCLQHGLLVMEGLTRFSEGSSLEVLPALAESWSQPSPETFVFKIRKNISFSDGSPLTAENVLLGWKVLLGSKSPYREILYPIVGARAFSEKEKGSFEAYATDPYTLTVHLQQENPAFPSLLSHPATFPRPLQFVPQRSLPTLGAFLLKSFSLSSALYVPNPQSPLRSPPPTSLEMIFVDNPRQVEALKMDHQIDFALGTDELNGRQTIGLFFNASKKPFHKPEARKALIRSMDVEELKRLSGSKVQIAERLIGGAGRISTLPHPFEPSSPELLKELGTSPIQLAYPYHPLLENVAKNLQAQWMKNLHLQVEIISLPRITKGAWAGASLSIEWISWNPYELPFTVDSLTEYSKKFLGVHALNKDNWKDWMKDIGSLETRLSEAFLLTPLLWTEPESWQRDKQLELSSNGFWYPLP